MCFNEVISPPFDGFECMPELGGGGDFIPEFNDTPRQHCDGEGHGQPEFHIVAGVVVASHQVHPLLEAVGEAGVVAPGDSLVVGEAAGALRLEVEEALGEGISVIKGLMGERKRGKEEKN